MKHISGKRMCRVLEELGWVLDHVTGSHHVYKHPDNPNTLSVPVHGNHDLRTGTQRRIMRETGLTDGDL